MSVQYYEGVGRRKESTARVRIMSGSGRFVVNGKDAPAYFTRFGDLQEILMPLAVVEQDLARLDISVQVKGGGVSGQSGAVKLGLARALVEMNPEWRPILRQHGLLTRDPRVKERKKPGLKRARKAPTYTKR